ncbi:hypothetical protein ANN_15350 [Periplaneta americana]|uniref:Uncharacterized protein n=1 Tax=Periplaneta americana TaxID=6978 RepID=A0ABQ8SG57_PERAM|nr:hypothetical protein ANN_15350 [Periplaneta americana]
MVNAHSFNFRDDSDPSDTKKLLSGPLCLGCIGSDTRCEAFCAAAPSSVPWEDERRDVIAVHQSPSSRAQLGVLFRLSNKKRTCVKSVLTEEMLDEIGHRLERSPTASSRRVAQQGGVSQPSEIREKLFGLSGSFSTDHVHRLRKPTPTVDKLFVYGHGWATRTLEVSHNLSAGRTDSVLAVVSVCGSCKTQLGSRLQLRHGKPKPTKGISGGDALRRSKLDLSYNIIAEGEKDDDEDDEEEEEDSPPEPNAPGQYYLQF